MSGPFYKPNKPTRTLQDAEKELQAASDLHNGLQLMCDPVGEKIILILDFDGVLAQMWTDPEYPHDGVLECLKALGVDENIKLCLASFNPVSVKAIAAWGVGDLFVALRAGFNQPESDDNSDLSKSKQIKSILSKELEKEWKSGEWDVIFIDDDFVNLRDVLTCPELKGVKAFHIPSHVGLSKCAVQRFL